MAQKRKYEGNVRLILVNSIRFLLIVLLIWGLSNNRNLISLMSGLALIATLVPVIVEKYSDVKFPAYYEVMILLFVYGILYVGDVKGIYGEIVWLGFVLNFLAAVALGFVGLTVLYVLYKDKKLGANPFIFGIFAFCFAFAIGGLWEVFEFGLDKLFGFSLQSSGIEGVMGDMIFSGLGALAVAIGGYFYVKRGKVYVLSSKLMTKFVESNPKIFGAKDVPSEKVSDKVKIMISEGEHHGLEFKSSLRTNLHTKQVDKKMEHAVLKTVNAYLNSNGGTLLVGVGDKGEVLGLDHDMFKDHDQMGLHFTNMLKNGIGSEFLPFIKFDVVDMDGKKVLKVDCDKSHKESFLKTERGEEFYVRNGPSSTMLGGREMLDYVHNKFRKS